MEILLSMALVFQLCMGMLRDPETLNRNYTPDHPEEDVYYEVCTFYGDHLTASYIVKYRHIDHDTDGYMKVYWDGKWLRLSVSVLMRRMPNYSGPEIQKIFPKSA